MKIISVMDILNGVAVHAVKGKRSEYQPLKSELCRSADPLEVASVFKTCGFTDLYVADLDAIMGKGENLAAVQQIAEKTGLALWVDAGVSDVDGARKLLDCKVAKVIVGTETLQNLCFIKEAIASFGTGQIVVSLDLKAGQVLCRSESLRSLDALELVCELQDAGVSDLIVLDLARVGSGLGVDFQLLKNLLSHSRMRLLVGGGVRGIADLETLQDMGVNGILLATALHSKQISITELRRAGLLEG
ncbi:MAG: HisA/HisF-related TIM barrel protein [Candidatus Bathyarchaeota archaeon]|nr:HisA/HisF-related TIM barrel protein [Candidatus Bathyarchaeota archaeon]